jgi:hypothetical protein
MFRKRSEIGRIPDNWRCSARFVGYGRLHPLSSSILLGKEGELTLSLNVVSDEGGRFAAFCSASDMCRCGGPDVGHR